MKATVNCGWQGVEWWVENHRRTCLGKKDMWGWGSAEIALGDQTWKATLHWNMHQHAHFPTKGETVHSIHPALQSRDSLLFTQGRSSLPSRANDWPKPQGFFGSNGLCVPPLSEQVESKSLKLKDTWPFHVQRKPGHGTDGLLIHSWTKDLTLFLLRIFCFFFSRGGVSLCSSDWPWTHKLVQARLHSGFYCLVYEVLNLQACVTVSRLRALLWTVWEVRLE